MATETAFELDTEAAGLSGTDAVHFANFPGVWEPGRPIAAAELGFESPEAAEDRVAELELPLLVVTVDAGSAPMPPRPNHLLTDAQRDVLDVELDDAPALRTHAQVDEVALDAGITEWPADVKTVAEKVDFLDRVRAGEVTVDGQPVTEGGSE